MAEQRVHELEHNIYEDLFEALEEEKDPEVITNICYRHELYTVGDYIEYTKTKQNQKIFIECNKLKELDLEKYEKLLRVDCNNLMDRPKRPGGWYRYPITNPYTI